MARQIDEISLNQALRWYVWIHHLQSLALKLNHKAAVTLLENHPHFHILDVYMYRHVQRIQNRKWGWFGALFRRMKVGTQASAL
jgi:hypothetical protein